MHVKLIIGCALRKGKSKSTRINGVNPGASYFDESDRHINNSEVNFCSGYRNVSH